MENQAVTQAVILAAGQGTRLRPLTLTRPKPLVVVGGKPLLEHTLEVLPASITSVVLVVGYLGEQIRQHIGDSYRGRTVSYAEQGPIHSTGGALLSARELLADRFLVMLADDLHDGAALERLVQHPLALLAAQTETPELFGVVTMTQEGFLKDIVEKPKQPTSNLISTGVMVLDARIFSYDVPLVGDELRLTDQVTALAKDAPVAIEVQEHFCSVGRPEDIPVAEAWLGERL